MLNSGSLVHEMKGMQFPFGVLRLEGEETGKAFIKKRYIYKDPEEYEQLKTKIDKLKTISHKNTINLRNAEELNNAFALTYQYVPHSLEDSFMENPNQTVKDMHRQFIELAIYLAKNCIVTAFSPQRCGVVIKEDKSTLKYYLPLADISLTDNRTMLERSVQLFNVQSMHYLDTLFNQENINQTLNSTINDNSSQRTFKNRVKLFPNNKPDKFRRDSQPNGFFMSRDRKFSNIGGIQDRKLSTLSRQLSEISQIHKRNRASTRGSGGSFNTFQSIVSLKSQKQMYSMQEKSAELEASKLSLRRCLSHNGLEQLLKVENMITRSKKALQGLQKVRQNLKSYKGLYEAIKRLQRQY